MNTKLLAIALLVVLLSLAVVGAGWKWRNPPKPGASGTYRIAGWTWSEAPAQSQTHGNHENNGSAVHD